MNSSRPILCANNLKLAAIMQAHTGRTGPYRGITAEVVLDRRPGAVLGRRAAAIGRLMTPVRNSRPPATAARICADGARTSAARAVSWLAAAALQHRPDRPAADQLPPPRPAGQIRIRPLAAAQPPVRRAVVHTPARLAAGRIPAAAAGHSQAPPARPDNRHRRTATRPAR